MNSVALQERFKRSAYKTGLCSPALSGKVPERTHEDPVKGTSFFAAENYKAIPGFPAGTVPSNLYIAALEIGAPSFLRKMVTGLSWGFLKERIHRNRCSCRKRR